MALLFVDGFDAGDATRKWNLGGTGDTSTVTPFDTGMSWQLYAGAHTIKKSFTPSAQVFLGFHYRTNNTNMQGVGFVRVYGDSGNTQHLSLVFTGANTIALYRGATMLASGPAVEPLTTWAYIEMSATIHDTTGTCTVMVNGTPVITYTGDTKNLGSSTNIDAIAFTATNGAGVFFDNFYICDATGPAPYNTFLGEIRIQTVTPNGAGSNTQFTSSAGANHTAVDELPYSATDYVSAMTSGMRDTYAMGDVAAGYDVLAVQNNIIAKKTDAGGTAVKPALVSNSTVYYGPTVTLTATDATISDIRTVDPATSAAWTVTGVNNMEAGMEIA